MYYVMTFVNLDQDHSFGYQDHFQGLGNLPKNHEI